MSIPLLDTIDQEILMHRDAHFGSSFDIMIEYYRDHGVGVMQDFELKRIKELQVVQKDLDEDLGVKVLPMPAVEQVMRSKELYHKLREVYENNNAIAKHMSDLILTEEEVPTTEIDALVKEGKEAVDPLIHLIDSAQFYDPLNPGYGRAPMFAAIALGKIKDSKAIPHLFNAIGKENFSVDESILLALKEHGDPAKDFLLKRLSEKPFNKDNEHAAIALTSFPPGEDIALIALSLLSQESVQKLEAFASYLTCLCEGLTKQGHRKQIHDLTQKENLLASLKNELKMLLRIWNFA